MMLKREAITAERVELLQSCQHSGFNLNTTRRVAAGDRQSLETLLQYIERPPVSLRRWTYRDDGMVHYRSQRSFWTASLGGKFHPGLGRDHQLVTRSSFSPCSCLTSLCDMRSRFAPTARSRPRSGSNIPERVRVDPGRRGELDAGRDYRR
jgi:hypothetical protein